MAIVVNGKELEIDIIISFLNNNEVINAVKWTRDQTGIGLKKAYEIVSNIAENKNYYDSIDYTITNDNLENNSEVSYHSEKVIQNEITINGYTFDASILIPLINENKNLQAIKHVKEVTNLSLKESKELVAQISESLIFQSKLMNQKLDKRNIPFGSKKILKDFFSPKEIDTNSLISSFKGRDINEIKEFFQKEENNKKANHSQKGSHFIKKTSSSKKHIIKGLVIVLLAYIYFYYMKSST